MSRTPFHSDVFGSFSWSTNILGCKKWILLVPGEEEKLLDRFGNTPFSINKDILATNNIKYFILHQNAGETVFVPSGWYHQVWNLTDTISINHNWFNACNVDEIWKILFQLYQKVLLEIDDCKDMDDFEGHCQIMLRAAHGMNIEDFVNLLENTCENRIKCLKNEITVINGFEFGKRHLLFDLAAIINVLQQIRENFKNNENILKKCLELITVIKAIL